MQQDRNDGEITHLGTEMSHGTPDHHPGRIDKTQKIHSANSSSSGRIVEGHTSIRNGSFTFRRETNFTCSI